MDDLSGGPEPAPSRPALSWNAVLAGALAAIATALILYALAAGLGFAGVSPWSPQRVVGAPVGVWLVMVQALASGLGGYLAGRLRAGADDAARPVVQVRDAAHGFLAWAVATVFVAAIAALAPAAVGPRAAEPEGVAADYAYDADSLYRTSFNDPDRTAAARAEVERVLRAAGGPSKLKGDDRAYLASALVNRIGLKPEEARERVEAMVGREEEKIAAARAADEEARRSAAVLSLLTALSLLVGAVTAGIAAVLGGRHRGRPIWMLSRPG